MEIFTQWNDAFVGVLDQAINRLAYYFPNVMGAFLLLLVGLIVASF